MHLALQLMSASLGSGTVLIAAVSHSIANSRKQRKREAAAKKREAQQVRQQAEVRRQSLVAQKQSAVAADDEDDDDCSDDDLSVLEVEDAKGETRSESDQVVHFGDAPGEERVEILDM